MLRSAVHYCEDSLDELKWDFIVEQVAHGVDEYRAWLLPTVRFLDKFRMQSHLESVGILELSHSLQTAGKRLGITELATRTDLVAASYRIPGVFSPFYVGVGGHLFQLLKDFLYCNLKTV
jgi:hypothetical protein